MRLKYVMVYLELHFSLRFAKKITDEEILM